MMIIMTVVIVILLKTIMDLGVHFGFQKGRGRTVVVSKQLSGHLQKLLQASGLMNLNPVPGGPNMFSTPYHSMSNVNRKVIA